MENNDIKIENLDKLKVMNRIIKDSLLGYKNFYINQLNDVSINDINLFRFTKIDCFNKGDIKNEQLIKDKIDFNKKDQTYNKENKLTFSKFKKENSIVNMEEDLSSLPLKEILNKTQENLKKDIKVNKVKVYNKWKLYRIINGHEGWVRCVDVEPLNDWFVTGSSDRMLKFWELANGKLKHSLTGHIGTIRSVKVGHNSPYAFSCGEDAKIKCWDLNKNQELLNYHGHISGVYTLSLHLNQNIIASGGRDAVVRIWDIRTKKHIAALEGHNGIISSVVCNVLDPQIISSSQDATVRFYDLRNLKTEKVLTYHKKGIRTMCLHPFEQILYSGGSDKIKQFNLPSGDFVKNFEGKENAVLNSLSINTNGVLVGGYDNGNLTFWDSKNYEEIQTIKLEPEEGSIESEAAILCSEFDKSSSRLITGGCDKTIRMWKEIE